HDKARRAGEDISETADDLYSAVTQHIGAVKTTKSFGAEERNLSTFTDVATRSANAYLHALKDYSRVSTMHAIGAVVILAALVYVGVEVLRFPVAAILLLLFLFARLVPRISALHQSYYSALSSLPAFTRVISVADEFESLAETPVRGTERLALVDEVALSDVRFSYRPEARDNVVERVRMRIAAQQTTAIVGPSGAGKSTLADIVMGLLAPNEGDVLVDGRVLRPGQVGSWRRGIGYVAQDTFLFHASVEENLRWASPHASEADLWEALSLAAADDFVRRLPQGLGTAIGDRGVLLSGGERQRIALARALLRKPSLLILDEATSSLDAENEQRIQQAIADLHGRLTILIITHRLTTVRDADVIYVVDAGRIVEHGDWDDLIARPYGRFRALCAAMGMGEEIPLVSESLGRS
ncbi:MAG TPA: ABC transporter ATP-binding protein, partial [Gemmatimonadaceae bacterium]|nr:ABC transporter ATP-binding protein [Gemmatimonadaceae bacterium]